MENANSGDYLEKIKIQVIENLRNTGVPSVQMQDTPRDPLPGGMTEEEEAALDDLDDDENQDVRTTQRKMDGQIERDDEFDDSEDEPENDYGLHKANGERKSRNSMIPTYDNLGAEASDVDMDSGVQTPQGANEVDEATSALVTEANAKVNAEVMEKKQLDATAALMGEVGPSNAPSGAGSIKLPAALDRDGDVEMTEDLVVPEVALPTIPTTTHTAATTPPLSPTSTAISTAPVAAPAEAAAIVAPTETATVKQEGEAERMDEDVKAEVSTVIAEQSQP